MLLSKLIADVISRKKPAGAGRFVYICDCLRDHAGHFSVIAGSMIRGMRALNVETRVYSHRDILSDLKKELDATGIFSVWPYVVTSTDPLCGSIKTYFDKSRNFELEVAGITELAGNDMVFDSPE